MAARQPPSRSRSGVDDRPPSPREANAAPPPRGGGAGGGGNWPTDAETFAASEEVFHLFHLVDIFSSIHDRELTGCLRIPTYFSVPASNAAVQLKHFHTVVYTLLRMLGREPQWAKYDDPTTIATNMVIALGELNLGIEITPAKFKHPFGEATCAVLRALLKELVVVKNVRFAPPEFEEEKTVAEEVEPDESAEVHATEIAEDYHGLESDDELYHGTAESAKGTASAPEREDHQVVEATVDPAEWMLEVERVTAKLRVSMPHDPKEWRTHLAQTVNFRKVIEDVFPDTKRQLSTMALELSTALEKVQTKEEWINSQFQGKAGNYRVVEAELQQEQKRYNELNETVTGPQGTLSSLTDQLETIQREMDEKTSTVTDTAPLVKIKSALKKIKADIRQMELRIGVVAHTLLQAKMRSQNSLSREAVDSATADDY